MKTPPRIARWILSVTNRKSNREIVLGDFEEFYDEIHARQGSFKALLWIYKQALKSIPRFVKTSIYWGGTMFTNNLKIAVRQILKQKMFSFINITGLALGMASFLLIMIWVFHELSYDKFHKNSDNLFQINLTSQSNGNSWSDGMPIFLAPSLKEEIPEIIDFVRYGKMEESLFKYNNKMFFESDFFAVDSSFFNVFSFPLIEGDRSTVLKNPYSVVISESMADKYFGNEKPIGKIITMNNRENLVVTGIMKDVPDNSSLKFDMLLSFNLLRDDWDITWGNWFGGASFLMLKDKSLENIINARIDDFMIKKEAYQNPAFVSIRPLTEIHYSEIKEYIYIFSSSSLFILLIASVNFINLSTARSSKRAKEIGMRKIIGAKRKSIIFQFLGESLLVSFISFTLAIILVILLLPALNSLTNNEFTIASVFNYIIILLFPLVIIIGIGAGFYPALFISSFQPVRIIKGDLKPGSSRSKLRRGLVVFQFSLAVLLIYGTCVVQKQIGFIKTKNIGYDKEQVLRVSMRGITNHYLNVLKNELSTNSNIINVSGTSHDPTNVEWMGSAKWPGKDPNVMITLYALYVDYDFIETMGIDFVEGRYFNEMITSDNEAAYIINEAMLKQMDMKSAVGKPFTFWKGPGQIIGVVKNFHFESLYEEINPMAIMLKENNIRRMLIRIRPENISATLNVINDAWDKIVPNVPFTYSFLDEDFNNLHVNAKEMGKLLTYFAILAIITGCLGLFGLVSYAAEMRTKEIGIRKVLGSSIQGIVFLLSKEFTFSVIIANLIALPIAYYLMDNWINEFAYKTSIGIEIFIIPIILSIIIAIATVSFQSFKAAAANPIESIKYE
ncbi:ABC transporter permease [Bacteroidota bacterium]